MTCKFETKIDFKNPIWNCDTWARIQGDLNSENERISYAAGDVLGVVAGQALKPLCGFETFLATRLIPNNDGTIRRLNKEVIFYTDLNPDPGSRCMIDSWTNPYNGEECEVVHVANDPFNYTISEWLILAPEDIPTDGSSAPKRSKIPLLFPWRRIGDRLVLQTDMHLYYPNALQPDKWPRESSGKMARVSEIFRYWVDVADVENPELTAVPYTGTWMRVTPWLPWMLMGQEPGHCQYAGIMTGSNSLDIVPDHVIEFARDRYPQMLSAPTEDYGPSISSLEYYAREQTPKPPKD